MKIRRTLERLTAVAVLAAASIGATAGFAQAEPLSCEARQQTAEWAAARKNALGTLIMNLTNAGVPVSPKLVNDMYYYSQMEASYSKAASEFWTCA